MHRTRVVGLTGTLGRYRPRVDSATLFGMDERHPTQSSFAPGNTGNTVTPGAYGAPGGRGPAPNVPAFPTGGFGQVAYDAAGYPAGGYGVPPYGAPGVPPGFPPELIPPGYNPWLGAYAGPRYASVWSRIGAYLIDGIILAIINSVAQIVFVGISGTALVGDDAGIALTAFLAFAILVLVLDGIYVVSQEAPYGQTIGKRALGIKVVKADGSSMDVDAALIRYGFLFFSFLGLGGLVTLLMVALSDTKQRIGDRVAGTIVVKAG